MKLLDAPNLKVGTFAVGIAAIVAYMAIQVGDNPKLLAGGQKAFFLIPDAGGLVKGAQVKMSGIPVGIIRDIRLQDGKARVEISVATDSPLTVSAVVRIKSQGILGDKYVDIYPGSPTDPVLGEGEQIQRIQDQGSLDQVIGQVSQISEYIKKISANLAEAVTDEGTNRHVLGRIIRNVEKLTSDLSEITAENKDQIREIVTQLNNVTRSLDEILNEPGEKGLKNRIQVAMTRLDNSLKNIEEITGKINSGNGTLGKLISDESTSDKIDNTLDGIENLFGGIATLQTAIDFQSQYLGAIGGSRTEIGIKLQPGLDRHYYIGIVDDPSGVVEITDTRVTQNGNSTLTTEEKTFRNKIKFSLWFAKTYYNLTIRAGLIQSSGGVGFDYLTFNDRLQFSLEMFEFSNLNIRSYVQYKIWKGFYATAGAQDILNKGNKYSNFLGVGLLLTNDDLVLLLSSLPNPR
jgi:phospholipid/cholesterol/gamma-HCH transport system substrate-binding protein